MYRLQLNSNIEYQIDFAKFKNSKSEIRNPKQIPNPNGSTPLTISPERSRRTKSQYSKLTSLEFGKLEFRNCLEFRYSNLVLNKFWTLICNLDFCILIFDFSLLTGI
jgi:hypothetical protein